MTEKYDPAKRQSYEFKVRVDLASLQELEDAGFPVDASAEPAIDFREVFSKFLAVQVIPGIVEEIKRDVHDPEVDFIAQIVLASILRIEVTQEDKQLDLHNRYEHDLIDTHTLAELHKSLVMKRASAQAQSTSRLMDALKSLMNDEPTPGCNCPRCVKIRGERGEPELPNSSQAHPLDTIIRGFEDMIEKVEDFQRKASENAVEDEQATKLLSQPDKFMPGKH